MESGGARTVRLHFEPGAWAGRLDARTLQVGGLAGGGSGRWAGSGKLPGEPNQSCHLSQSRRSARCHPKGSGPQRDEVWLGGLRGGFWSSRKSRDFKTNAARPAEKGAQTALCRHPSRPGPAHPSAGGVRLRLASRGWERPADFGSNFSADRDSRSASHKGILRIWQRNQLQSGKD